MIFHLTDSTRWALSLAAGEHTGSTRDLDLAAEGYIHCSTASQWPATADRFYADVGDLIGADVVGVDQQSYGRCVAVVANPAHDLLELESGALVPVVFIVATAPGRLTIDPPEGLFDLLG